MSTHTRWSIVAFALPALIFAGIVYFPITGNYFYLDDFLNLYHIVNDEVGGYLVRENGGHLLFTRNSLFYLTFQLAGPTPEAFYWSAYLTHLVNVLLLFVVIARLTGYLGLASFGAAFWGISPLNEGALGWYSVYGHVVVGTALLIILAQASRCVATQQPPSLAMRCFWYVLALIAATSFGTGVGIAMALPFVLWLLLYPLTRRPPLLALLVLIPAVYVGFTYLFEQFWNSEAPARAIVQDGLIVPAAVWKMFRRVTGFGITEWATGFVLPAPRLPIMWNAATLTMLATLIVCAEHSSARVRRQLAGCALIVVAAYGIIAIGRGALIAEGGRSLIEQLTRYHYAAPIALTVLLCLVLAQLAPWIDRRIRLAALIVWYAVAGVSYARSSFEINQHQLEREQTTAVLADIRAAIDAVPVGGTVTIKNSVFPPFPLRPFVPGIAAAFTMFYESNVVDGRRVEFVDFARHLVAAHKNGKRIGRVLVAPP